MRWSLTARPAWLLLGAALAITAVSGCAHTGGKSDVPAQRMQFSDLGKTDVDQLTEIHLQRAREHLATLMLKLYRRNPSQWRSTGRPSAEFVVQRVFRGPQVPDFAELEGRRGVDAVRLAFDQVYRGDRVLAFIAGLTAMLDKAYGDKREFFLFDSLDPQKLYNSARNIEIAAWQLRSKKTASGQPLLLSNSMQGEEVNLSFERLFGKLISLQDTLALVVAGRTNRAIRTVVQRMATAVFLPL